MNPLRIIFAVLSALLVIGRFYVPHMVPSLPGTYEALAHVSCGILLGLWMANRDRFYLWALISITIFEGAAFFVTK